MFEITGVIDPYAKYYQADTQFSASDISRSMTLARRLVPRINFEDAANSHFRQNLSIIKVLHEVNTHKPEDDDPFLHVSRLMIEVADLLDADYADDKYLLLARSAKFNDLRERFLNDASNTNGDLDSLYNTHVHDLVSISEGDIYLFPNEKSAVNLSEHALKAILVKMGFIQDYSDDLYEALRKRQNFSNAEALSNVSAIHPEFARHAQDGSELGMAIMGENIDPAFGAYIIGNEKPELPQARFQMSLGFLFKKIGDPIRKQAITHAFSDTIRKYEIAELQMA